jgi:hypothetical protein
MNETWIETYTRADLENLKETQSRCAEGLIRKLIDTVEHAWAERDRHANILCDIDEKLDALPSGIDTLEGLIQAFRNTEAERNYLADIAADCGRCPDTALERILPYKTCKACREKDDGEGPDTKTRAQCWNDWAASKREAANG